MILGRYGLPLAILVAAIMLVSGVIQVPAKDRTGEDTYVLCEINVSSVAPYPESAVPFMAQAALKQVESARDLRRSFLL